MKDILNEPMRGTLIYLRRRNATGYEICLAWKNPTPNAVKRGLADKWNGYGGGIKDSDASPAAAAIRELREECGVVAKPEDLILVTDDLLYKNKNRRDYHCHIFFADIQDADPKPTAEMSKPTWFPAHKLPYQDMMDNDRFLMASFVLGWAKFKGIIFNDENMNMIGHDIKVL